jgi:hypothetical protein
LVHLTPKVVANLACGDRHADDYLLRLLLAHCPDRSQHRSSSCEAVINQNHGPAANLGRGTIAAVGLLAAGQFTLFARFYQADHSLSKAHFADQSRVKDADTAGRNRSKGQLLLAGHAELANH